MISDGRAVLRRVCRAGQSLAQLLILVVTLILAAFTLFAALGWTAWPELPLSLGGARVENAGMWLQIGLTVLMATLLFWLPANARMARLETGHRSFAMGVADVTRAYRAAHESDRAELFGLSSEFDAIRERMEALRRHPDFQALEPELLQLAAQMSHETRSLAQTYSDAKVARAKAFLQQRQEEIDALNERLRLARGICDEMRRWLTAIEADESQARLQLRRLEADLREILPGLGYAVDIEERAEEQRGGESDIPDPGPMALAEDNVVPLPRP